MKEGGKPYPEVVDRVLPCHDLYWPTEEAMAEGSPAARPAIEKIIDFTHKQLGSPGACPASA